MRLWKKIKSQWTSSIQKLGQEQFWGVHENTLLPDKGMFDPGDLIHVSLDATPHGRNEFDVYCYEDSKSNFENVKNMNGKKLFDEL